jgi:hypothetical protein
MNSVYSAVFAIPVGGQGARRTSTKNVLLMLSIRRWLRQRLARRLAIAMRDAFLPSQLG